MPPANWEGKPRPKLNTWVGKPKPRNAPRVEVPRRGTGSTPPEPGAKRRINSQRDPGKYLDIPIDDGITFDGHSYDRRGVKYPPVFEAQKPAEERGWYTTTELAKLLDPPPLPEQVHRWCTRWFGRLPPGRSRTKAGYMIPLEYLRVARVMRQTEDVFVRRVAQKALVDAPRDWVVVVGKVGLTCYTEAEVGRELAFWLPRARVGSEAIHIFHTGEPRTP